MTKRTRHIQPLLT